MAAQQRRQPQAGEQDHALDLPVPGPVGHLHLIPLQKQEQRGGQGRDQGQDHRMLPADIELPGVVSRLPEGGLRADGLRVGLGLRFRRRGEGLRLLQGLAGKQAPFRGQKGLLCLLHHRVHGAAHHVLQGDGPGVGNVQPGHVRLRRPLGLLEGVRGGRGLRRRGRLRRRFLRRGFGNGRRFRLLRRSGLLRGGGGLGGSFGIPKQVVLQAAAVLRQDFLQGIILLRGRGVGVVVLRGHGVSLLRKGIKDRYSRCRTAS